MKAHVHFHGSTTNNAMQSIQKIKMFYFIEGKNMYVFSHLKTWCQFCLAHDRQTLFLRPVVLHIMFCEFSEDCVGTTVKFLDIACTPFPSFPSVYWLFW